MWPPPRQGTWRLGRLYVQEGADRAKSKHRAKAVGGRAAHLHRCSSLHAAARAHLGGVVGHEAAALREEPPVARRAPPRAAARRSPARRSPAAPARRERAQLEARHLVLLRQLPQVERSPRLLALPLAEVELVGEEVADESGEAGEVRFAPDRPLTSPYA